MMHVMRLLRLGLALLAGLFIGQYLFVALSRLAYPFELEWMEGGSLVQVVRILNGQPLYVRPSFEFIPYIYTPLYFYISAAFATALGPGFLPLRFVSFAASLLSLALIGLIIRREGASRLAAFVGASLYAATFALSAAWFDLARVDSLLVMWLLLAIYLMRRAAQCGSPVHFVLAGLVLGLAWFTKQTAVLVICILGGYAIIRHRHRGLIMVGVTVAIVGLGSIIWNAVSDGWFNYYIFYLPSTHELTLSLRTAIGFLFVDLLLVMPVVCWFGLWWVFWPNRSTASPATRFFYVVVAFALIGLAFMGRANPGGFPNVLMTQFAVLAILLGLGLDMAGQIGAQLTPAQANWFQIGVYGLALVQFVALLYPVSGLLPSQQDRLAGEQLLDLIRSTPGEVYVPYHGYLALQAGKHPYVHPVALDELYGTFGTRPVAEWSEVYQQMQTAITARNFSLVVQDQQDWLQADLERYYVVSRQPIFATDHLFRPVTGRPTRPEVIYVPGP